MYLLFEVIDLREVLLDHQVLLGLDLLRLVLIHQSLFWAKSFELGINEAMQLVDS